VAPPQNTEVENAITVQGIVLGEKELQIALGYRDELSVQILSTVEKIGTTNPQQVAAMELEGYS